MSGKTILYVEDNAVNRRLVRDLLQHTSYTLIEADDGVAGVSKALEMHPSLILMDIQLPKMSVWRRCASVPMPYRGHADVAITSFALSGDDQKEEAAPRRLASPTARAISSR
jgi:two-component system cell cycle response regulator DivK